MIRIAKIALLLGISCFALAPALPNLDPSFSGAAFAGGKGDKGDKGDKGKSADHGNSGNKDGTAAAKTKGAAATKPAKKSIVQAATTETLSPSQLGKMNGAMNANINAVLAHIRNGQTTSGPVGLLAGLAVADALAGESTGALAELEAKAQAHTALEFGLTDSGYATLDDYLAAKEAGTVTEEDLAKIDGLIEGAGGLTEDGTALAEAAPTAEELAAAEEAAAAAGEGVTAAEDALVAAWNKDGDAETLLDMARDKLEPYQEEIAATVEATAAGTDPVTEEEATDDDLAETPEDALPEDGVVVETPLLLPEETTGG
ncbi:hypothetical protein [Neotabrizicola sp. sgz301269]|uniref:hypothetical protein n=1 Tax=Neotabrizicola sp. sgz301269 TaxID=3276282 RepID=UPI00377012D6